MPARGELCIHYKLDRKGEPRPVPLKHQLKTINVKDSDRDKCEHLMFYNMDQGTLALVFKEGFLSIGGIGFANEEAFRASLSLGHNQSADAEED